MAFITAEHLKWALTYLATDTHSLLISLLAGWRNGMAEEAGEGSYVRLGKPQENAVMQGFSAPVGGTTERPFYVPFGDAQGKSRWRDTDYSGSSLQRQRKERSDVLRQKSDDQKFWALAPGAVEAVKQNPKRSLGVAPVNLALVGVWLFRQSDVADLDALGAMVVNEFKVPNEWIDAGLFVVEAPAELKAIPLQSTPMTDDEVLAVLQPVPSDPSTLVAPQPRWADIVAANVHAATGLLGVERPALQALAALKAGKHVVFTGAPGTGKTSLAVAVLEAAGRRSSIAPATDAWTTFETIGGYFPDPDGAGESLDFLPGVVVSAIEGDRCLVIDELNRADIDKAFGELFTLLAGAPVSLPYRRKDGAVSKPIRLARADDGIVDGTETIVVSDDWRIIGTMNDADKASLKRLSLAFVRRFAFVPIGVPTQADYEAILAQCYNNLAPSETLDKVREALGTLFASDLAGTKSVGFPIGPAIPKTMLEHAAAELSLMPESSVTSLLSSALSLYLAPQLQGRPDLHTSVMSVVETEIDGDELSAFGDALSVWTGYSI